MAKFKNFTQEQVDFFAANIISIIKESGLPFPKKGKLGETNEKFLYSFKYYLPEKDRYYENRKKISEQFNKIYLNFSCCKGIILPGDDFSIEDNTVIISLNKNDFENFSKAISKIRKIDKKEINLIVKEKLADILPASFKDANQVIAKIANNFNNETDFVKMISVNKSVYKAYKEETSKIRWEERYKEEKNFLNNLLTVYRS